MVSRPQKVDLLHKAQFPHPAGRLSRFLGNLRDTGDIKLKTRPVAPEEVNLNDIDCPLDTKIVGGAKPCLK